MEGSTLSRAGSQMLGKSESVMSFKSAPLLKIETTSNLRNILFLFIPLDKISVHDMVKLTMNKNEVFGIDGYNLPRHEHPTYKGTVNKFPTAKGKNFAEVQASYTKIVPGPGEYDVKLKWGCVNKP